MMFTQYISVYIKRGDQFNTTHSIAEYNMGNTLRRRLFSQKEVRILIFGKYNLYSSIEVIVLLT